MEDDPQQQVESLLPYERWIANALRHVVVQAIEHVSRHGLPGGHHFYISFRTDLAGGCDPGPAARAVPGRNDDRPATSVLGPETRPRGADDQRRTVVRRCAVTRW